MKPEVIPILNQDGTTTPIKISEKEKEALHVFWVKQNTSHLCINREDRNRRIRHEASVLQLEGQSLLDHYRQQLTLQFHQKAAVCGNYGTHMDITPQIAARLHRRGISIPIDVNGENHWILTELGSKISRSLFGHRLYGHWKRQQLVALQRMSSYQSRKKLLHQQVFRHYIARHTHLIKELGFQDEEEMVQNYGDLLNYNRSRKLDSYVWEKTGKDVVCTYTPYGTIRVTLRDMEDIFVTLYDSPMGWMIREYNETFIYLLKNYEEIVPIIQAISQDMVDEYERTKPFSLF